MRQVTGHINVARSVFDHPMFDDGKPYSTREAWLWLLSNAAWRPMKVMVRNGRSEQLIELQRGQLTYSRSFLRRAWRWSSDKAVRTFLTRLRREGMVDLQTGLQTGQLQTVISICNYGVFQNGGTLTGPANGPAVGQQWASNGPEEENIINIKRKNALPSPDGFQDWYAIYPKKKSPEAARRAFAKVIGSRLIALPALMEKTKAFAAGWAGKPKVERQFIPYPASWLNAGSYDDEPEGGGEPVPVVDPRAFTEAQWGKRLQHLTDSGVWMDAWGPKPGAPGCLVPPHLIVTPVSTAQGAA